MEGGPVTSESPLVSVVLPCFQAEEFVGEAVRTLLDQTHAHLEVLALDDGSTDGTRTILEDAADRDPRVRVLVNETNLGLIPTLNRGVREARGTYIARMDADDLAHPRRFQVQLDYLASHPEVGVVGSSALLIDGGGRSLGALRARCLTPGGTAFMVLFANPLVHPTVFARAEVLKAHPYSQAPEALHTEDYALMASLSGAGIGLANVAEPLLTRRLHGGSVSRRYESLQVENFVSTSRAHLDARRGVPVAEGAHRVLVNRMSHETGAEDLRAGLEILDSLEGEAVDLHPEAAEEIRRIGWEQRGDILIQALRRGVVPLKVRAAWRTLLSGPGFVSSGAWRYLVGKVGR